MKKIKAYWDSWESDDPVILYIPESSEYDYDTAASSVWNQSDTGLTFSEFYEAVQTNQATFLCRSIPYTYNGNDVNCIGYLATHYEMPHILPYPASGSRQLHLTPNAYMVLGHTGANDSNFNIQVYYRGTKLGWNLLDINDSLIWGCSFPSWPDDEHMYTVRYKGFPYRAQIAQFSVVKQNNYENTNVLRTIYEDARVWNPEDDPNVDPDDDDPDDEPDGGDGNFDKTSDEVVDPGIPADLEEHSAIASGLVKVYSPTAPQLITLAQFLWSPTFDPTTIKKLFNDGFGAMLGLSVIPVPPSTSGSANIFLGDQDTGVQAAIVNEQFKSHEFGSLAITPYWGSYLDFNPYTTMELYLPYAGFVPIDPDDYMDTTMNVRYTIDVISGEFLAIITARDLVIDQVLGSCAQQIPLTASDHSQYLQNWVSATLSGIQTLAAINSNTYADTQTEGANGKINRSFSMSGGSSPAGEFGGAASSAKSIMSMKERYKHSGGVAGAAGHMGVRYPYIIYRRARQASPAGINAFTGYPSNKVAMLSSLSGFTSVSEVNLRVPSATAEESSEILSLLMSGVIL